MTTADSEAAAARSLGVRTSGVFISRDDWNQFQADAADAQAQRVREDIAAAPPLPPVESPTPAPEPPPPPTPAAVPTAPSPPALGDLLRTAGLSDVGGAIGGAVDGAANALGSAVRSVVPAGPPALNDLLSSAGLAPPPADTGPPPLENLLRTAGLADTTPSTATAATQAQPSGPPQLADLMRSAGLLDQPQPAQQPAQAASTVGDALANTGVGRVVQAAVNNVTSNLRPSQFGVGLSDAEAYAACGPVAALAFAHAMGRNPTAQEAVQLAKQVGWTPAQGMAGPGSELQLLRNMNIPAHMETGADPNRIAADVQNGNPVMISTPGHYFVVDGYDPNTGKFHAGSSGTDLKAGAEWMSLDRMQQVMGTAQATLFLDRQAGDGPSVAADMSAASVTPATPTTVGLSGGVSDPRVTGPAQQTLGLIGQIASKYVGDLGAKAAQAVGLTEGALVPRDDRKDIGDNGNSFGWAQLYRGGQLQGFAADMGMPQDQAGEYARQHPEVVAEWAFSPRGTNGWQNNGYLGSAIQAGIQKGLTGADLATYAQQHGQVSVSPERAGQNYAALFGGGQGVIQAVGGAAQAAGQAAQQTFGNLAQTGGQLAQQGAALTQGLTQPLGESPTAPIEREANQRFSALQNTLNSTLQQGQQAQDQRSVQASVIGGGLRGRGAVNVADAGGSTPEQIAAQAEPPKPLWQQIGDTIGSAISQGLQPLVQAFQGTAAIPPPPEGGGYGVGGPLPAPTVTSPALPQPTGAPTIVPEGGGYGAAGMAPIDQTGPIGQVAVGAGQLVQQVQSPNTGNPLIDIPGVAASALGTTVHAVNRGLEAASPFGGGAVSIAGSDQLAQEFAARGGLQLQQELQDLQQRRLNGEQGLEPRIQEIGARLNEINDQITNGQPFNQAVQDAAERNPNLSALQATAGVAAAGLATPLAAEGAPLIARAIAEVLQPGTNPVELAHQAFSLLGHADSAAPATEDAIRAAWESFGQRWSDSAAQRERMLSQIGDPRGFLERVRDNLTSAGGAVARGAQGVLEDISRPTRVGVVGEAPAAANADRFYHGTGADFPRPDQAKFDPNGLFGPGYYLTSDPRVAGGVVDASGGRALNAGYAQQRGVDPAATAEADRLEQALQNATPQYRADNEGWMQDQIDRLRNSGTGPNVRAVDVPKDLNLLDAEAPLPSNTVSRLATSVQNLGGDAAEFKRYASEYGAQSLSDVQEALKWAAPGEDPRTDAFFAQRVLADAGYDGIRYDGGKRIPLADQAGQPIEHTAVAVFPESLDKLRNATAGTRGGLLPDLAGEGAARQVAGRAAIGAVSAGAQEAQQPDATPGDIATAAAQGAVLGAGRALIGRAIPGLRIPPEVGRIAQLMGGPPGNPRSFDLNRLAQMRQQYQAQQPPLINVPPRSPGVLDRLIGFQAANMLSGVGTQIQNVLGNLGAMAARPAFTAAAGYPMDAVRDVAAMGATLSDAFAAYGRTFTTGYRTATQQRYQAPPVGGLLGVPLRNLAASDEFFRVLNSAGAAASEASRRLRENPTLTFDQVLQRHANDIVQAAAEGAARAVYEQGGGAVGELGNWLARQRVQLLNSNDPRQRMVGLGLQWLVPMSRVPAVILGEGIRSLPVINEVTGAVQVVRAARAGDTYAARQAFGRTWLTSAANLAIYNEVLQGNITGDGPTNPEEKARLMEAVDQDGNATWRPSSVRLPGGRWLDYSGLGPIALQMSTIANLSDLAKDEAQKPPEKRADLPQQAMDMLGRTVQTIGNAWYLRTLSDVLGAIKDGNVSKVGSMIGAVGDRFIPAEALLNEIRRIQDPLARQPGNLLEREENRVPFASQLVPPRIASTTGLPLEQPRDVFSTIVRGTPGGMMTPNPVAVEIARLDDTGNRVSVPSPTAQYAGAQQTPEQQRLIQQQIGQATDLYVLHTMQDPKYAGLTDQQKADALSKAHAQARSAADITLGNQVARSPHESALLQWAQVPHFAGINSKLPPEQIARQNFEVEQARAKLSEYRQTFKDAAENRLRRDDPQAYRLSQRDPIDKEVLDRKKKAIDKASGGALLQTEQRAAGGGLPGVGSTVLPPVTAALAGATDTPLPTRPPVFAAAAAPARQPVGATAGGGSGLPTTPPVVPGTDQFRAQQNADVRAARAKLADYRRLYGADAERRLQADDPLAWTRSRQSEI